jgi:hypothetical protein
MISTSLMNEKNMPARKRLIFFDHSHETVLYDARLACRQDEVQSCQLRLEYEKRAIFGKLSQESGLIPEKKRAMHPSLFRLYY